MRARMLGKRTLHGQGNGRGPDSMGRPMSQLERPPPLSRKLPALLRVGESSGLQRSGPWL